MKHKKTGMSRRQFSRNLALIATTAAVHPGSALGRQVARPTLQQPDTSKLTPEGEAQYQMILSRYGATLTDEQGADVRRLVGTAQKTGEDIQKFELENWNEPAPIFRVYIDENGVEEGK